MLESTEKSPMRLISIPAGAPVYVPATLADMTEAARVFEDAFDLSRRAQELFCTIFLDAERRVLAIEQCFQGGVCNVDCWYDELFKRALFHEATGMVVCHNHPDGDLLPSPEDMTLAEELIMLDEKMNIQLLGDLVIAGNAFTNMRPLFSLKAWKPPAPDDDMPRTEQIAEAMKGLPFPVQKFATSTEGWHLLHPTDFRLEPIRDTHFDVAKEPADAVRLFRAKAAAHESGAPVDRWFVMCMDTANRVRAIDEVPAEYAAEPDKLAFAALRHAIKHNSGFIFTCRMSSGISDCREEDFMLRAEYTKLFDYFSSAYLLDHFVIGDSGFHSTTLCIIDKKDWKLEDLDETLCRKAYESYRKKPPALSAFENERE